VQIGTEARSSCCSSEPTVFTLLRIFSIIGIKNVLNATGKNAGNPERQWQSRIVFSSLDRIDSLSGHLQLFGERRLGPFSFGSQYTQTIFHR